MVNKDLSLIPRGLYCYDDRGTCTYWSSMADRPPQENGYCAFLEKGDQELQGGLLWDQCKECGINNELDEEDLE